VKRARMEGVAKSSRKQLVAGWFLLTLSGSVLSQSPLETSSEPKTRYGLQRQELGIRGGVSHSDNIGRDSLEQSGTFATAGFSTNLVGERNRIAWALKGLMDYHSYNDSAYDDEPVGAVVGQATIDVVEDRLSWDFMGNYGQLRTDASAPESPDNRESVSSLEMGPALTLPLSASTVLSARGRMSQRQSGGAGALDSTLTSIETGFFRYLDALKQLGVFVSKRAVEFDDNQVPGYDVESAFFRYQQELRAGSFTLEMGSNQLQREGADSDSGLFTRVNLGTSFGTRSSFNLYAIQDFQDSAYSLRDGLDPDLGGSVGGQVALTSDPMERLGLGVNFGLKGRRMSLDFAVETAQESYKSDQEPDRDTVSYRISFSREILSDLRVGLTLAQRTEEFDGQTESAKDLTGRLSLGYRLSRTLELEAAYRRWNREGGTTTTEDLSETQFLLTLIYAPWSRRS
jgi:hypothetical protein